MAPPDDLPVTPTPLARVREVLGDAFIRAVGALGDDTAVEVDLSTGHADLPPSDARVLDAATVQSSATRTATGVRGTIVLHETRTAYVSDEELRTTIALTGASESGERFWLGATSYAGAPVTSVALVGDLPDFAGSALDDVLAGLPGADAR